MSIALLTILILFVGTLVHSTLGFGLALVTMPLLALILDLRTATPLVAFVGLIIEIIILWQSWREVDVVALWRLIGGSLLGIPVGLFVLILAPEAWIKVILGVLLILFSLYNLLRPRLISLVRQNWAYLFGFASGVLGGAYNLTGPPVILYGTLSRWPPVKFRANMQSYFVPITGFIFLGHGFSGLWTVQVLQLCSLTLPLALLAIVLGANLNRRLPVAQFERLIYGVLIILGLLLFL